MAATLKSITSERATLYFPVHPDDPNSDKIKVVYLPKALTGELVERMAEQKNELGLEGWGIAMLTIECFIGTVVEWDFKREESDSDPIPLTREGLKPVPTMLLDAILGAITADQRPDPTTKKS